MITLTGFERIVPYINGSNTGEVAEKLGKRYEIFERFYNDIEKELQEKFMFHLNRYLGDLRNYENAVSEACRICSLWLTDRWRSYIESAEHGLTTKASQERGDPAFIDTQNFYRNTFWELRDDA